MLTLGKISKRKDGRWEAQIRLPNKKKKSIYGKTKTECNQKAQKFIQEFREDAPDDVDTITFRQWSDIWLNVYCKQCSPNTIVSYRNVIRCANKHFGDTKLKSITPLQCQKLIDSLDGLADLTIQNYKTIITICLNKAVDLDYIVKNPMSKVKTTRKPYEVRNLRDFDLNEFLNLIEGSLYEYLYKFVIFTGLRISELVALTWNDVDFDNSTITVSKTFSRRSSDLTFYPTKNKKSRLVPLSQSAKDVLKAVRSQQNIWRIQYVFDNPLNLVFTHKNGGRLNQMTIQQSFKKLVSKLNYQGLRFHDLRHVYAVLCIQSGIDFKTISESLGHANVAFTMQIYAYVNDDMRKAAADKFDDFFTSNFTSNA